jgi:hypothetical protein
MNMELIEWVKEDGEEDAKEMGTASGSGGDEEAKK